MNKEINNKGKVVQVIGPVVDIEFSEASMPAIGDALLIQIEGKKVVLEVAKHLESGRVRAFALASTDGLARGAEVEGTGEGLKVPVGQEVLGRVFNVVGEPVDGKGPVAGAKPTPSEGAAYGVMDRSPVNVPLLAADWVSTPEDVDAVLA